MKRTLKILGIIFVAFIINVMCHSANAASANLNVSSTQVEVGNKVNVTVNINAAAWEIHVGGAVTGNYSDTSSDGNNVSKTETLSFTPTEAGKYKITLSGNVADQSATNGETTNVSGEKVITVTEKKVVTPTPAETPKTETPKTETPKTETPTTETPAPTVQEPTFQSVNETVYAQSNVNIRDTWSTSGKQVGFLNKGDKITRTGIGSNGWDRVSYNGAVAYVNHSFLTTKEPEEEKEEEKSSNKLLKELEVEGYELAPAFNPQTTRYELKLKDSDTKLNIKAKAQDEEKASVDIDGNSDFKVGNNIVKITVTAEDGTTRMYTITVAKANEQGEIETLKLSSLTVKNATLEPSFNKDTTNYIVYAEDPSTIKESDVVAVAEDSSVKITTYETESNSDGEKVITIMLDSADGDKSGVYQITVKKPVAPVQNLLSNGKDNSIYYILGAIIAVLLILIIIVIVALRKTRDDDDDDDYDDEDFEDEDDENNEDYTESRGKKFEKNSRYDAELKSAIDEANTVYEEENDEDYNLPKSQILSKKTTPKRIEDYNVFKDEDNDEKFETKRFEMENDDLDDSSRKRGKHF